MGGAKFFQWKKLIGTIQSVSPAVPYADLFYRSLQGNRCKLTLPEPSCGSSPPSLEPSSTKVHDLQSVLFFIIYLVAQNLDTNVHLTNLFSYCHSVNANPITYEPTIIAQYLKQLYDDGCSYSSVTLQDLLHLNISVATMVFLLDHTNWSPLPVKQSSFTQI